MKIYVGNLPDDIKEKELRYIFAKFGEVTSVRLMADRAKPFAYIDMPSKLQAGEAIDILNGTRLKGANLKVRPA